MLINGSQEVRGAALGVWGLKRKSLKKVENFTKGQQLEL